MKAKTHAEKDAYQPQTNTHYDACNCMDVQLWENIRKQKKNKAELLLGLA